GIAQVNHTIRGCLESGSLRGRPVYRFCCARLGRMKSIQVNLPEGLAEAAQLNRFNPSEDAARLLALELFREDKISLGRAAELCETPVETFMEFAGQRNVPLHYGADELEEDRQTLKRFQR